MPHRGGGGGGALDGGEGAPAGTREPVRAARAVHVGRLNIEALRKGYRVLELYVLGILVPLHNLQKYYNE